MSLIYETIRLTEDNPDRLIYRRHGSYHRKDNPAIIWPYIGLFWYEYGQMHRLDGPAIILGEELRYYIRDELYHKEDYYNKLLDLY